MEYKLTDLKKGLVRQFDNIQIGDVIKTTVKEIAEDCHNENSFIKLMLSNIEERQNELGCLVKTINTKLDSVEILVEIHFKEDTNQKGLPTEEVMNILTDL